jgi:hypothetical protein
MRYTAINPLFLVLSMLGLLTLNGCATSSLEHGNAAFERGDYAEAEAAWMPLAERGDARAQFNLALLVEKPRPGRDADLDRAEAWYRAAAEQGYLPAMTRLANLHRFRGDDEAALALYTLAARLGSDDAAAALRAWGRPVPPTDLEAALVKQRLAEQRRRSLAASPARGGSGGWDVQRTQDYYWQMLQSEPHGGD